MLIIAPIERGCDAFALHPGPAIRKPQRRIDVAAIGYELVPLGVGDKRRREFERFQQNAVARPLVIEGEAIARMADADRAAGMMQPIRRLITRRLTRGVNRIVRAKRIT